MSDITVVGAGLAGCEAAWQIAKRGFSVDLIEMKPVKRTPAHVSDYFAELVCSNSLRSNDLANAVGLLKEEMRIFGGLIISCADATRVEAGSALAVDRTGFSRMVTERLSAMPNVSVIPVEAASIPDGQAIIATGPLTSDVMSGAIAEMLGGDAYLNFYDAAAPIITLESIDMESAYFASRYDRGNADYINCPMEKEEYDAFVTALVSAEEAKVHGFDDGAVFEGCMPVEVMARRGADTLRYGPLKPIGLRDPRTGREAYAVVQLRRDNEGGTLYNMVGFQTHLTFGEQRRVFSMIPALKNAEFVRYGVMHRNTYINSTGRLDGSYRLLSEPRVAFAGQMTGVEGYVESAGSGMLAGIQKARELAGIEPLDFTGKTALGALARYISCGSVGNFQPMNVNFGIIEPLDHRVRGKRNKNTELSRRSLDIIGSIAAADSSYWEAVR